jgi:hypothetical protein
MEYHFKELRKWARSLHMWTTDQCSKICKFCETLVILFEINLLLFIENFDLFTERYNFQSKYLLVSNFQSSIFHSDGKKQNLIPDTDFMQNLVLKSQLSLWNKPLVVSLGWLNSRTVPAGRPAGLQGYFTYFSLFIIMSAGVKSQDGFWQFIIFLYILLDTEIDIWLLQCLLQTEMAIDEDRTTNVRQLIEIDDV